MNKLFNAILPLQLRKRYYLIASGMILNGLMEMISIASIAPFLAVAANQSLIHQNWYLKLLYDFLNLHSSRDFLLFLGGALIVMVCLANACNALFTWLGLRFVWSVNHVISVLLIQKYINMDYLSHTQRNSADLQKNIQTEALEIANNVVNPTLTILNKGMSLLLTSLLLILINPALVLFIGAVFGTIYYAVYFFTKKALSHIGLHSLEDNEAKFRAINEAWGVFKIAKLLNCESFFVARYADASMRFSNNQSKRLAISQLPRFAVETVAFSIMVGICLYVIGTKSAFSETIPILGIYVFAAYRIMPGIQQIYSAVSVLRSCWPHVTYLADELTRKYITPPIPSPRSSHELKSIVSDSISLIEFRNVCFLYSNCKTPTLRNISFSINAHTTVGFFGPTGSGKTTIINLILGVIYPYSGAIFVKGEPLNIHSIRGWQQSIGYVPQDIYLMDNTIAENIAFGIAEDRINMEQVREVASMANISEFIERELPDKYKTRVGERSIRLSGGQRQRIGIARALYHNPQLLVFDEATSALDYDTERSVMEAIDTLTHRKSIIIIAHRLSTLKNCDSVFKVDSGAIEACDKLYHKKERSLFMQGTAIR